MRLYTQVQHGPPSREKASACSPVTPPPIPQINVPAKINVVSTSLALILQVGDLNLWNLHNPKQERFYSGKTRQLQRSHLSVGDRLWSNMPHLRPMATVSQDSLSGYGIDADGCSVHDVIGTRCDPYTYKLINGVPSKNSCHQALTKAIEPYGLDEYDVHDVFNIFMCSGFDRKTHEYLIRGSPVEKGDYIELVAEMDLLLALCACPQGDVSSSASDSDDVTCFPLDVCVGQPDDALIAEWREAQEN